MRAETKRRLAVFAVCALGIGCLYWVPEIASSPNQMSGQTPTDQASRPQATVTMTATETVRTPAEGDDSPPATPESTAIEETSTAGPSRTPVSRPTDTATSTEQSTDEPTSSRRQQSSRPSQVGNVSLAASDHDGLTVSWSGAENASRYRVWLNGYAVKTTSGTSAKLDWFNSDDTHVVQIQAIDDKGNASRQSRALTLSRPAPEATDGPERPEGDRPNDDESPEETTPPDRPQPSPQSEDDETPDPRGEDSEDPTDEPTDEPSPDPTDDPPVESPTPTPSPTPDPTESPTTPDPNGLKSDEPQQQQQVAPDRTSPSPTPSVETSPTPEASESGKDGE